MRINVSQTLGVAEKKFGGYTAQLSFQLQNLCIKAEVAALLSITVEYNGTSYDLEHVADAALLDDYQFAIIPKDQGLLFAIGKGIKEAHPEFKMEEKEADESTPDVYMICCTMPEVNKDRYDACNNYVKLVCDEASAYIEATNAKTTAKLATDTATYPVEEIDEAKDSLKELYDMHSNMCTTYKEDKIKEIEEAYQKYLAGENEKESAKNEMDASKGEDVGFKMELE